MAQFQELIKNFEKVRNYVRDFLVYGYKIRLDFTEKSSRSYDNERRRIENFLAQFTYQEVSAKGKRLYISANTVEMESNPLFPIWEAKSFTKNDILLHYVLLEILRDDQSYTLSEITDRFIRDYGAQMVYGECPDPMTLRNKLNEYVKIGLIQIEKKGKVLYFRQIPQWMNQWDSATIYQLHNACRYYQNIAPLGVVGHFLNRNSNPADSQFAFRHMYIVQTLEDEVLFQLLEAIRGHQSISMNTLSCKSNQTTHLQILPLRILNNVITGRRYVVAYHFRTGHYCSYRLDHMSEVKIIGANQWDETHLTTIDQLFDKVWGVALPSQPTEEKITMDLFIDEIKEIYVLQRLKREGRNGVITQLAPNHYRYEIVLYDLMEIVPWLRTFIGRITNFEATHKPFEQLFFSDLANMNRMYD